MPHGFVPWRIILREIHASVHREHGILAKDIHTIEGFAGNPDGDTDEGQGMRLCDRAFSGDPTVLAKFALHAWDDGTQTFLLARGATEAE